MRQLIVPLELLKTIIQTNLGEHLYPVKGGSAVLGTPLGEQRN